MENSGAVLQTIGALAVLLIVLAVFGLVGWMIWRSFRSQKAREALLTTLGFSQVKPAAQFLQRVERLYRRGSGQRFRLTALFERPDMQGGSFYVFDLVETSGDETTHVASGSVAYISPDLRLPRFHASGRLALEGKAGAWMAGMAEKVVSWAATRVGMSRLDLGEFSEIDERLMVLAEDETAAQAFLTRERLGRLLWLANPERLSEIDCGGDCFVVRRAAGKKSGDIEADLRSLLDDAKRALTALS